MIVVVTEVCLCAHEYQLRFGWTILVVSFLVTLLRLCESENRRPKPENQDESDAKSDSEK